MKVKFDVAVGAERIELTETWSKIHEHATEHIYKQVIELRDAQIRAALIALGWTPPKRLPGDKP